MSKPPHVLMLFLDGVGIGKKDVQYNPFFAAEMKTFSKILGGEMIHLNDFKRTNHLMSITSINTTLRIAGLPQSGTGQASLLTGLNSPRLIGKHFGPYLYSSLKPIVAEKNIFIKLHESGKKCFYANAFPKQYFEYLKSPRCRITAITYAWQASGGELNDSNSLYSGNSLSADITNERWHRLGYHNFPIITPQEAGKRLVEFTKTYDFVLYEYFFTDHVGHDQSMSEAKKILEKLDSLLEGIIESLDMENMLFIMTSDHGNIEDLSTKSHTRNPVPFLAVGRDHRKLTSRIKNLTHIAPSIVELLNKK